MQVDREALARAAHKYYCHQKNDCDGTPDETDYDTADLTNEMLALVPAEAVSL